MEDAARLAATKETKPLARGGRKKVVRLPSKISSQWSCTIFANACIRILPSVLTNVLATQSSEVFATCQTLPSCEHNFIASYQLQASESSLWRHMAIAQQLNMPLQHLLAALVRVHGDCFPCCYLTMTHRAQLAA